MIIRYQDMWGNWHQTEILASVEAVNERIERICAGGRCWRLEVVAAHYGVSCG